MKLKKFLEAVDPVGIGKTTIWGEDETVPIWEGDNVFDIPWWITDLKINYDEKRDAPISLYHYVNKYNANMIGAIINVVEK